MDVEYKQSPEDKALVERLVALLNVWEPYHQKWMDRANHFYGLYRNYQNWRDQLKGSSNPRGQDAILRDGQQLFGPELFVPMCFSTVETIIPAMLASPPSMANIKARNQASEGNVANVKAMIEAQQEKIGYELVLQTIAKDGLIYGTGVQKVYWKSEYRIKQQLRPSAEPGGGMVPVKLREQIFDDPDAISIDPRDFIVDPFAATLQDADGCFHRAWRSNRYVQKKIETQQWRNLEGSDLAALASTTKFDAVRGEKEAATPQPARSSSNAGKQPMHEVLEFHDGDQVITMLDRKVIVASGPNPNWHGEKPFQVYRPTEDTHAIHGIGEIEPIESLQEELNVLRTERRYNAALVLQKVFAYHEGQVEKEDIGFGPGFLIGVNGDPRELIREIQVGDIPNSSYEEEDRISADIDRTSGISDTVAGAGMEGGTATGVQLVQSAASRRIENKTRRLHLEIIDPGGQQFLELDQQRILDNREVPIPAQPTREQPERRWAWVQIGPLELMGEFTVRSRDRSTQPENIPQNRADAQMAQTLFGENPVVDPRKVAEFAIRRLGVEKPEEWLAAPEATIPAATLDNLVREGVPPELVTKALAEAGGPDLSGGNPAGQVAGDPIAPGPQAPPEEGGGEEGGSE